jgi:hypothetical protein
MNTSGRGDWGTWRRDSSSGRGRPAGGRNKVTQKLLRVRVDRFWCCLLADSIPSQPFRPTVATPYQLSVVRNSTVSTGENSIAVLLIPTVTAIWVRRSSHGVDQGVGHGTGGGGRSRLPVASQHEGGSRQRAGRLGEVVRPATGANPIAHRRSVSLLAGGSPGRVTENGLVSG